MKQVNQCTNGLFVDEHQCSLQCVYDGSKNCSVHCMGCNIEIRRGVSFVTCCGCQLAVLLPEQIELETEDETETETETETPVTFTKDEPTFTFSDTDTDE